MSSENSSGLSWIITGASSGFGYALAEHILEQGEKALLVARRGASMEKLVQHYLGQAKIFLADITDHITHEKIIARAVDAFGRIDVLANIAGKGCLGAAEEFSDAELPSQMDLNFFAAAGLSRAALPQMRTQKSGHILNLTSVAGLVPFATCAPYCASKFALEGWTASLKNEVAGFGIKVTLIEPGAFRTEFAGNALLHPAVLLPVYESLVAPMETYFKEQAGKQMGDPAKAAAVILAAVKSKTPPAHLMLGRDAYAMWAQNATALAESLESWRKRGEDTAFDGESVANNVPGH